MLDAYSVNIDVTANSPIPFNNIKIQKGCTAVLSAPSTIQLNKAGVYEVTVDASATGTAAGDLTIELVKAGIVQPQGQAIATLAEGSTVPLSFTSLVQVSQNNTCRCCDSPTILQVMSNDVDVTYPIVDITVTKIC